MESAAFQRCSEESLWINLSDRVDSILDERKPNCFTGKCDVESKESRFREDSILLIKGFDSVSSSFSQLTDSLAAAQQGLDDLAKHSVRKSQKRESQRTGDEEDEHRKSKKQCGSNPARVAENSEEESKSDDHREDTEDGRNSIDVTKSVNLKKAKNLAVLMVSKATSLAKELKMIRAELHFMQEKCTLLEEENRRFREDDFEKREMADGDDLVRLQLEALLAEKSRLANENANLVRENQCLQQLVEYHKLALESLAPSYEEEIDSIKLDFSFLERKVEGESDDDENVNGDGSYKDEQSREQENQASKA